MLILKPYSQGSTPPRGRKPSKLRPRRKSLGQLGIRQGAVSEVIDVAAFRAKEEITSALSFVEDARATLDEFCSTEPTHGVRKVQKRLHRASRAWAWSQAASLANAGVRYASIATADVGTRAVRSGLHTLRAQALRVGTGARTQQAKQANSIPINNRSLFGVGLRTVVAKAMSTARNYAAMADGLAQAVLHKPTPPQGRQANRKRKREGSPTPFRGCYRWPTSMGWRNRSSSKGRKPTTSPYRTQRTED